eukprot:12945694-Alexandrium_andersonii.AAC.3
MEDPPEISDDSSDEDPEPVEETPLNVQIVASRWGLLALAVVHSRKLRAKRRAAVIRNGQWRTTTTTQPKDKQTPSHSSTPQTKYDLVD